MSRFHNSGGRAFWARLRRRVFARDGHACTECGAFGKALECHHIKALADGGLNVMENLRTVCRDCHITITSEARGDKVPGQRDWERFAHASRFERSRP